MTKQDIMKKILREIEEIPPIPENILKIKELIKSSTSSVTAIGTYVRRDPALMADLLKVANSAWYMTRTRVGTPERAIATIGLRQLETIVLSIGAKKVLGERYAAAEQVWDHSYKCAFYAQNIARMKGLTAELENSYTAGLLHDIGKLVLLSLTPKLVERIMALGKAKQSSIHEIEKLAIGLSHAEIGEKIAANWHFPSTLAVAIGRHHDPLLVKDDKVPLTYITYLANVLANNELPASELLGKIEPRVLQFFNIVTDKQLESIMNTLREFYSSSSDVLRD